MKKLKNYARSFIRNDEGAELIEWAIVVAVAGILFVAAAAIVSQINDSMTNTGTKLKDGFAAIEEIKPGEADDGGVAAEGE